MILSDISVFTICITIIIIYLFETVHVRSRVKKLKYADKSVTRFSWYAFAIVGSIWGFSNVAKISGEFQQKPDNTLTEIGWGFASAICYALAGAIAAGAARDAWTWGGGVLRAAFGGARKRSDIVNIADVMLDTSHYLIMSAPYNSILLMTQQEDMMQIIAETRYSVSNKC